MTTADDIIAAQANYDMAVAALEALGKGPKSGKRKIAHLLVEGCFEILTRLSAEQARATGVVAPIEVYVDGSGTYNVTPCGCGVVFYELGEPILEASRFLGLGTNNHAELSAIRVALWLALQPPLQDRELIIRSDSEYAIGMVTRFPVTKEQKNGPLALETIRLYDQARKTRPVTIEHVKGHSGVRGNERADVLASLGRKRGL